MTHTHTRQIYIFKSREWTDNGTGIRSISRAELQLHNTVESEKRGKSDPPLWNALAAVFFSLHQRFSDALFTLKSNASLSGIDIVDPRCIIKGCCYLPGSLRYIC